VILERSRFGVLNTQTGVCSKAISYRPLWLMSTNQERLYNASRVIERVSLCLLDLASCSGEIDYFDLNELVGRLDLAVDAIRSANGASN